MKRVLVNGCTRQRGPGSCRALRREFMVRIAQRGDGSPPHLSLPPARAGHADFLDKRRGAPVADSQVSENPRRQ